MFDLKHFSAIYESKRKEVTHSSCDQKNKLFSLTLEDLDNSRPGVAEQDEFRAAHQHRIYGLWLPNVSNCGCMGSNVGTVTVQ